ncbi:MAG: hypothetical protein IKU09_00055 [Firmicutes bacterium]|nr:hypothetical protein [Bacillota bacterium]
MTNIYYSEDRNGGCHYSTEKYAPMAMVKFFEGLGMEAEFIEEAPHLSEM